MSASAVSSQQPSSKKVVSVYWFRNALRFHDNPSLLDACQRSDFVVPLYIIDPDAPFRQTVNAGCIRANFVLESIQHVDDTLRQLNPASRMLVLLGSPDVVLPKVLEALGATDLYYEREPAAPMRQADQVVLAAIRNGATTTTPLCTVHGYDTHTLHPMETYLAKCKSGTAPATYGGFTKLFDALTIPDEVNDVTVVPPLPERAVERLQLALDDDNATWETPTLADLGYYTETSSQQLTDRAKGGLPFVGGEQVALQLLERQVTQRAQWAATFEKPKTSPNALMVDTTGLSPYVKHGCLSPRRFYNALAKVYAKFNSKNNSKPPVSLHGQLMWREYNYLMGYSTPHFDQMVGNPVVRQIPWDDDPELLAAWREARTGYPFIDAVMTQLRQTGWIHHLARHSVACFLTRGDLWQSWERGAAVFEELLVDADWSINNFNWQWLSCSAHFYQYFRCYSPVSFGKKTDPNGDYIRKWLPQFKTMPAKFIYEPWDAPLSIQRQCGVIVGENYPHPIVEHKTMSKSNMGRMKAAYDAHNANPLGNDNAPVPADNGRPADVRQSAPKRARRS